MGIFILPSSVVPSTSSEKRNRFIISGPECDRQGALTGRRIFILLGDRIPGRPSGTRRQKTERNKISY